MDQVLYILYDISSYVTSCLILIYFSEAIIIGGFFKQVSFIYIENPLEKVFEQINQKGITLCLLNNIMSI